MFQEDYSPLEKRVLQSFREINHEHRYVCKKRWRKLKQRGRTLCKDENGYYWLRPPKVCILNNSFDKFFVYMRDAAKYPERCVLCDSFPQYTVTGRFVINPLPPSHDIQGKSNIVMGLARKHGWPIEELKVKTDSEFSFLFERMREGDYSFINVTDKTK